jgi:2'-5' RNA ligase
MENGLVPANQQELWEYLLVAHPDADVNNKIVDMKQSFVDVYKQKIAIKTKPHITIANFLAKESMEETLIRYIHRICKQYKSFAVTLNNYSGFPPNKIYVRVQDHEPFKQLASQLKVIDQYVQANGCPQARITLRPHLTIAGGLDIDVYNRAMLDYSQKTFHETFQLTELVLLKRSNQFDHCRQVNIFCLYPPDINTYNAVA